VQIAGGTGGEACANRHVTGQRTLNKRGILAGLRDLWTRPGQFDAHPPEPVEFPFPSAGD
jgi:hypothetical protein